jgi:hypothetical protein
VLPKLLVVVSVLWNSNSPVNPGIHCSIDANGFPFLLLIPTLLNHQSLCQSLKKLPLLKEIPPEHFVDSHNFRGFNCAYTHEWDNSKRSANTTTFFRGFKYGGGGGRISTTTTTTLNSHEPLPWPPGWKNHKIGLLEDPSFRHQLHRNMLDHGDS